MANVRVIPATAPIVSAQVTNAACKRRVAAYARVSTDSEEQLTSYEAQVDYYTKFINNRSEWEFITVYTDEGISAVNTKKREGFKQMVADGLAGKFDLLVTKSVSRFARNTVDSLTTVRKLKEKGVEVWFEKENIYTLDSKGELLITIMSSLAQEESRSISENVTWGQRKRMADGKITLPYKQFLGYCKGEDGLPKIVPEEAEVVRLIFRLFMEGKTYSAIAKHLVKYGFPTPAGKETWQACVVQSILTNEKYKGHALMQKTYCANFLTKKMVKNTGQVQQYYVEDSHPAIVDPDEWEAVQAEIMRRKKLGSIGRCGSPFSGKIVCGECGGWYGKKVWGSYKSDKTYRREVYRCNDKYKGEHKCETPAVTEDEVKERFLTAFNTLMENRDGLIEDCRLAQSTLCDTTAIDTELAELLREIEVVAELSRKAIFENARTAQSQNDFNERNNGYLERHRKAMEQIDMLEAAKQERLAKSKTLEIFIRDIESRPLVITEFNEALWLAVIDRVAIATDGAMTFTFRNVAEVTV
ncbi:recombinase family protein [Dehalococcoides mccartyi]|uniref:recombinase family protein n=1 Tax=Dehalococcoides mccartyi TaxID=61435 RepID=UPI0009902131|nr:recombinase family protein [Dehalococcoides mccartyi]AQU05418.1 recombinase family protein [Dehalococcoides mccartyi]AQU06870.1 recombinase family protein [Dehalococcoides mccartyi]